MAYASLTLRLGAPAVPTVFEGIEIIEAAAQTTTGEPAPVILRARSGAAVSKALAERQTDDLVIVNGDLALDQEGGIAVLNLRTLCVAYPDQFLNDVVLVGRLSGNFKVAEKSVSTSLATDRFVNREPVTDWFRIRFYGGQADRLQTVPKGSLLTCCGMLDSRTNKEGNPYPEIKGRTFRVIRKGKGSSAGTPNPAAGTAAVGYDQADFEQDDENSFPMNWD